MRTASTVVDSLPGRKDAGGRYFKRGWFQAALETLGQRGTWQQSWEAMALPHSLGFLDVFCLRAFQGTVSLRVTATRPGAMIRLCKSPHLCLAALLRGDIA